jgi:hypothetical protein
MSKNKKTNNQTKSKPKSQPQTSKKRKFDVESTVNFTVSGVNKEFTLNSVLTTVTFPMVNPAEVLEAFKETVKQLQRTSNERQVAAKKEQDAKNSTCNPETQQEDKDIEFNVPNVDEFTNQA